MNLLPSLVPDFDAALYASLIFLEVTCAAIVLVEWRSGRVRWPIPVLLGYYLFMHVTLTPLATSKGFQEFQQLVWNGRTSTATESEPCGLEGRLALRGDF